MRGKLLYPPGTCPFDETHSTAAGMHMCLSPDSRCVSTDYNWHKDLLAPGIDGTVMHIEHQVNSVAVYVCSDDTSCHIQPYAVEHLLCLALPAYDDWGALLSFMWQHTAYCRSRRTDYRSSALTTSHIARLAEQRA